MCTLLHELININYAILNSRKWKILEGLKILEFQGLCIGIYYISFFLKFLQIKNNIPYLLAAQKKSFFVWNFCTQATWKSGILNSPCLKKWAFEKKIDRHAQLMSYFSYRLLLVSVIIQLSNLEEILISTCNIFFMHPEELDNSKGKLVFWKNKMWSTLIVFSITVMLHYLWHCNFL